MPETPPPTRASPAKKTAKSSAIQEPEASLSKRHVTVPPTTTTSVSPALNNHSTQLEGERKEEMEFKDLSRKSQWIALAVMSGACAAFNGVFAKLTTTELTTTFATWVANLLGLGKGEKAVEVVVRVIFFSLNLLFNAIMWTLFTKALARGTSTTQVSILNTSSNFMITAILGFLIFSESLPPLWFLGAALLVAGNVIIGRREEKDTLPPMHREGEGEERNSVGGDEDEELLGRESVELDEDLDIDSVMERGGRKRRKIDEDILQLDLEDGEGKKDEEDLVDLGR